jgi:hypothetical protein
VGTALRGFERLMMANAVLAREVGELDAELQNKEK